MDLLPAPRYGATAMGLVQLGTGRPMDTPDELANKAPSPDQESGELPDDAQQTSSNAAVPQFLVNYVQNIQGYRAFTPLFMAVLRGVGEDIRQALPPLKDGERGVDIEYLKKLPPERLRDVETALEYASYYSGGVSRIPSIILTAMVAELEVLIAEAIKWSFRRKPEMVRSIDRKLGVADLEGIDSIDTLKDSFIEKEVDEILRGNGKKQIEDVEGLLNIQILSAIEKPEVFLEIFERRNLILHTGGIVSRQYLASLRRIGYREEDLPSLGTRLTADADYFTSSARSLLTFGALLGLRVAWKFDQENRKEHDGWLLRFSHSLLAAGEYPTAIQYECFL
jgi:hypothetical protein